MELISLLSSDEDSDGEPFTALKRPHEESDGLSAYKASLDSMRRTSIPDNDTKRPRVAEEITLSSDSEDDDIVETTPGPSSAISTPAPTTNLRRPKLEDLYRERMRQFISNESIGNRERSIGLSLMKSREKLATTSALAEKLFQQAQEKLRAVARDTTLDEEVRKQAARRADVNARLLFNDKGQKAQALRERTNLALRFFQDPVEVSNDVTRALIADTAPTIRSLNQRQNDIQYRRRPDTQFDSDTNDGLVIMDRFPNLPQATSLFARNSVDLDSDSDDMYNAGAGMDTDEAESIRNLLDSATVGLGANASDSAFDDVENMTPDTMHSQLLPHQSIGVKWMLEAEAHESKRGGLLGDGMGLGKTVQAIALWANKSKEDPANSPHVPKHAKCTLIIAPVGLLHMWNSEFQAHMKQENRPRTLLYHGTATKKQYSTWEKLSRNDIILVSFQTLVTEHKKQFFSTGRKVVVNVRGEDGKLHKMKRAMRPEEFQSQSSPFYEPDAYFYRIIIDEAHSIKNRNTESAKACYRLDSVYRWCLTGTPMQNSVEDLQSLVKFLRIKPYDKERIFNQHITSGIKKAAASGQSGRDGSMKRLQSLLTLIMLRRDKDSKINGKPILNLPPKVVETEIVTFSEDERKFYQDLELGAQRRVSKLIRQGGFGKQYQNVLVLLLRLRQACCHYELVRAAERKGAEQEEFSKDDISLILDGCKAFSPSTVLRVATLFKQMQDADDLRREQEKDGSDTPATEMQADDRIEEIKTDDLIEICESPDTKTEEVKNNLFITKEEDTDDNKRFVKSDTFSEDEFSESAIPPSQTRSKLGVTDSDIEGDWLDGETSDEECFDVKGKGKETIATKDHDRRAERLQRLRERKFGYAEDTDSSSARQSPTAEIDEYDDAQIAREEQRLAEGFECPICTDAVAQSQVRLFSACGHSICHECSISYFASAPNPLCMTCREPISQSTMVPLRVFQKMHLEKKSTREVAQEIQAEQTRQKKYREIEKQKLLAEEGDLPMSSKTVECIELLRKIKEESPGEKTIIFSQFVSFMDLIGVELDRAGYQYLRYEGSMNADARSQAVNSFRDDPQFSVLLISLKAGNVGLTLTAANHVIIMDPFWNPYVEEQAMDRAHRIGQQRHVTVHKIVVGETVEDRILALQKRKREMIESALDPSGQRQMARLSREELLFLFNMRQDPAGT